MARAGFIMQGAKGKLGDSVFGKGEKGTIQRVYSAPKNPKTAKQIAQRMVFATVNQAASIMYPLINHSFENVQEGKLSKREFVRLNTARLRQLAAIEFANQPDPDEAKMFVTTKGVSTLIPNSYIVSKGSLTREASLNVSAYVDGILYHADDFSIQAQISKSGNDYIVQAGAEEILNTFFGINPGEQLTFVGIEINNDNTLYSLNEEMGGKIKEGAYYAARIVANESVPENMNIGTISVEDDTQKLVLNEDTLFNLFDEEKSDSLLLNQLKTFIRNAIFTINTIALPTTDPITATLATTGGYQDEDYYPHRNHSTGDYSVVAGGFVRSALDNGKWRRSNCVLTACAPDPHNFGLTWNYCQEAYFKTNEIASDDIFLNTGGRDNEIA